METIVLHLVGNVGVLCVLAAYFLVSTGKVASISVKYQVLNLVGAIILTIYAIILVAWASVALNAIWALIALVALARGRKGVRDATDHDKAAL